MGLKESLTNAVQAVTVLDSKPYFFLFSDIDTKDTKKLLEILTFYRINHLSCYYYNTNHGFHVCSPCLLTFRKWSNLRNQLGRELPNYRFDALRISTRNDFKYGNYCNWNDRRFKESESLHRLIVHRFKHIENVKKVKSRETTLMFITYTQLTF